MAVLDVAVAAVSYIPCPIGDRPPILCADVPAAARAVACAQLWGCGDRGDSGRGGKDDGGRAHGVGTVDDGLGK